MKNSATRPCLGCGGSGLGVSEHDRACDLPGCASAVRCPACLGTGRVTDGPFRRDAEIDAETFHSAISDRIESAAKTARSLGAQAGRALIGTASETDGYGNTADRLAFYAARAAFRAIPALRGE